MMDELLRHVGGAMAGAPGAPADVTNAELLTYVGHALCRVQELEQQVDALSAMEQKVHADVDAKVAKL